MQRPLYYKVVSMASELWCTRGKDVDLDSAQPFQTCKPLWFIPAEPRIVMQQFPGASEVGGCLSGPVQHQQTLTDLLSCITLGIVILSIGIIEEFGL